MAGDVLNIVMSAHNEEEMLPSVLSQWYPLVTRNPDDRLIVVNNGSEDLTGEILDAFAKSHPQLIVINKENEGLGAAQYLAYEYAISNPEKPLADYVFQTDSDGQTVPSDFSQFWEMRHDYDVILGVRNERKDGAARKVISGILRANIRLLLHVDVRDANVPFRLMSRHALETCLPLNPPLFDLLNVSLSATFYRKHLRIGLLPITFLERERGTSVVNARHLVRSQLGVIKEFRALDKRLKETKTNESPF